MNIVKQLFKKRALTASIASALTLGSVVVALADTYSAPAYLDYHPCGSGSESCQGIVSIPNNAPFTVYWCCAGNSGACASSPAPQPDPGIGDGYIGFCNNLGG